MGEKSKLIGEYGERFVSNFLALIGWTETLKAIEFDCNNQEHDKRTHGIDVAFNYQSPLVDLVFKKVLISVKFTAKPYPNSPKTKFKEYFEDLAKSIDCFRYSHIHKNWIKNAEPHIKSENIGVLFWLSNDEDTYDDLIEKVSDVLTPSNFNYDQIYLVDNNRADFIYKSISFAKKFSESYNYSFFYPETGKNINPSLKLDHGKILPVEYINSSIIPIRLESKSENKTKLILTCIDNFEEEDLKRLINLSQTLSKSWASEIIIGFPDYNETRHIQNVDIAKSSFTNEGITAKIKVVNYCNDYRNLQENPYEE
ncbi:MAG: hypothetical protein WD048_13205 [Chitinophagales bacterium]